MSAATGAEIIQTCRDIVEHHQADVIDGVLMDAFTASAIVQIHDALNDEHKAKLETIMARDVAGATNLVWTLIKRAGA